MSVGPPISGERWTAGKAALGSWANATLLSARRRLAARSMPLATAVAILAVRSAGYVFGGSTDG
ncbi:MAG: hypothetical protein V3S78_02070 [Hyphomicrobium sp.]